MLAAEGAASDAGRPDAPALALRVLEAVLPPRYRRRIRVRSASTGADDGSSAADLAARLDRLSILRDAGMITEQEHATQQAALFDRER